MFELAIALIALFSASIFLAHAIEAYQAQQRTGPKPRSHQAALSSFARPASMRVISSAN